MQKKVLFGSLTEDELLNRINKGEIFYEDNNQRVRYKLRNNILCEYDEDGKLVYLNAGLTVLDNFYFLDELEEPEADESCIGKLCKFWDDDTKIVYNILNEIRDENEHIYKYVTAEHTTYEHCQALTKEEALALVKE